MPNQFLASFEGISPEEYIHLRVQCGLSTKTIQAATIGLSNSLFIVTLQESQTGKNIGMGRLIGDGGCHCQVADICVLPQYQGKGLGKLIMSHIHHFIQENIPDSCYINLIADGEAYRLYEQYGFKGVYPNSRGMGYVKRSL